MKILTTSFLTCAVKACKSSPLSFPLHYKDAELEQSDIAYNPRFLINILPRIDWDAVRVTATELGFTVPEEKPELPALDASSSTDTIEPADEKTLRELHTLLLETEVREGKLVCGNCGHEYKIKEGIANFLLPSHLGEFELFPFCFLH
ncbi:MAG: type I protein arginine N-methyltransferase Rmt1 [Heterodermia speciosa]|uniref:Multifunctional methyltransferase subunit trm112 n=1 Tax=Heterodermia speciosa TaxID=116794 RepID=A0A8H3FMI1_9LECA|nr:MAG: type I protein arginine N-methyltransferase Rmt1 [Heterodermia speciosa]